MAYFHQWCYLPLLLWTSKQKGITRCHLSAIIFHCWTGFNHLSLLKTPPFPPNINANEVMIHLYLFNFHCLLWVINVYWYVSVLTKYFRMSVCLSVLHANFIDRLLHTGRVKSKLWHCVYKIWFLLLLLYIFSWIDEPYNQVTTAIAFCLIPSSEHLATFARLPFPGICLCPIHHILTVTLYLGLRFLASIWLIGAPCDFQPFGCVFRDPFTTLIAPCLC